MKIDYLEPGISSTILYKRSRSIDCWHFWRNSVRLYPRIVNSVGAIKRSAWTSSIPFSSSYLFPSLPYHLWYFAPFVFALTFLLSLCVFCIPQYRRPFTLFSLPAFFPQSSRVFSYCQTFVATRLF